MTKPVRKPELLAPAGNLEKLKSAIQYGADAVYLAGQAFGLRAYAGNFSLDEMAEGIAFARKMGVRAYVTMNIMAHPGDIRNLRSSIRELLSAGPDAVIVSDPGVFSTVRELKPEQPIHISTQASVTNAATCRFWHQLGAKRIVLARELTLSEIREIRQDIPDDLELEAFVHGSMCMAYSGRCLLSNILSDRDGNRGRCSQPCRWHYQAHETDKPEQSLLVEGDERGSYIFNSKDLCMIEHIPELIEAGLDSFKIEGRVKGAYYVSTVVKAYRAAIDRYLEDPKGYRFDPAWMDELNKIIHREFDTGFFFDRPIDDPKIQIDKNDSWEAAVAGQVKAFLPSDRMAVIEQRNKIQIGDELELVREKGEPLKIPVTEIFDLEKNPIESTPHAQMLYLLKMPQAVNPGVFLRKMGNKYKPGQVN